ncbi:MAG: DUF2460 domain-containing protein, partial [Paracoccus sp. (in: a-proteobacteria)]|nr:DUF2460 domain-containing protein [Paracoccus sp. (in: a-proteobacteria)]
PAFSDQVIATGDGQTRSFQLTKAYRSGGTTYHRPICKPVLNSVRAGIGGNEVFIGINYDVDHATGVITFEEAPETGAEITSGYEFDVPVRFDTDRIAVSVASFQAGQVPDIPVIEVRI